MSILAYHIANVTHLLFIYFLQKHFAGEKSKKKSFIPKRKAKPAHVRATHTLTNKMSETLLTLD